MISSLNPVKWNSDAINYEFIEEKTKSGLDYKSMVTIANRSCIGDLVAEINEVAFNKFKAGAYLHWFY